MWALECPIAGFCVQPEECPVEVIRIEDIEANTLCKHACFVMFSTFTTYVCMYTLNCIHSSLAITAVCAIRTQCKIYLQAFLCVVCMDFLVTGKKYGDNYYDAAMYVRTCI